MSVTSKQRRTNPSGPENGLVSQRAIARLASEIVERFEPRRIILFGSYAYGTPTPDSDVDLLVEMPTRNMTAQACRIRSSVAHPFPLDLLVRTPESLNRRLAEGDWFLREIVERGTVLYEQVDRRMGTKGRSRRSDRKRTLKDSTARK